MILQVNKLQKSALCGNLFCGISSSHTPPVDAEVFLALCRLLLL